MARWEYHRAAILTGRRLVSSHENHCQLPKFLIIQTAFIGDAVLATGILEKLYAFFPSASIDFLVRKGNESLFTGHPYLHQLLVWDKQTHKRRNLLRMLRQIRRNRYDKVINLQRFAATGILTAFSAAGETIGFDKNPLSFLFSRSVPHQVGQAENGLHETARNNALISHFTDERVFRPRLYPAPADFKATARYKSRPYICLAPSSVWFTKQLPADQWVELLHAVPDTLQVYLIGGPADKSFINTICDAVSGRAVTNLAGELSLLQSAALMTDAVMNYVNDSSPMHLASAMNAPVTAVYCSTVPAFGFGPLSDQRFIVETPLNLSCRPCGLHGRTACPLGHFNCARSITTGQLLNFLPVITPPSG